MADELVFRISAIDRASKVAQKIQASFSKIASPLTKMSRRLVDTGKRGSAALDKIDVGMRTVAARARTVSDRIASIVPGLTAITGLLGTAGIGALADRWGNFGLSLKNTSRQLGISAQSLQAWHYAAQRAGVTAEQFDSSMVSSQNTIRGAAFGSNPQAMMLMNRLGVNISRTKSGDVDYQRTQRDLMAALGRVKNPAGQRTAAEELGMGSLLPMIQRGTYNADRQQAVANGYAPSENAIARAASLRDRLNDLKSNAQGLANTIGDKLDPVLSPMVDKLAKWLNEHRVDIANRLADAVKKFVDWITKVNWSDLYDKANKIADKFGGWGNVLRDMVALKFASVVAGWVGPIAALATNLVIAKNAAKAIKGMSAGEVAAESGSKLTFLGKAGITWLASEIALDVAKKLGLPDTNVAQGNQDVASGNWWAASAHLPALDFLGAARNHIFGSGFSSKSPTVAPNGQPLGIRSNNPLNMLTRGQENVYVSAEDGIAAAVSNLRRNYAGLTLAQIADKWTGGARTGNTPAQMRNYVRQLENGTGLSAKQRPDLNDSKMVAALVKAQIRAENGQQPYTDEQIMAGVNAGISGAHAAQKANTDQNGSPTSAVSFHDMVSALDESLRKQTLHVTVHAPPGTRVETPDQHYSRITYAMPSGNLP